jgi:predicted RNA-binding protein with PUA-like domain
MDGEKQYWLMKSEPSALSIDDLKQKKRWHWDGVRNYQARNYMRDDMRVGDMVIFYHSSCIPAGPAGIAKVASLPYPDHTQFDKKSKYFDPNASREKPIWYMVDVKFVRRFPNTISRIEMKKVKALSGMMLWKYMRLSITPLAKGEFDAIVAISRNKITD